MGGLLAKTEKIYEKARSLRTFHVLGDVWW